MHCYEFIHNFVRLKIIFNSLFYNHYLNWSYMCDTLLEPILWFVENFTAWLGPMFVLIVSLLTTLIVYTAYYVGFPFWWKKSPEFTIVIMIIGNWLLINICFHYYMGINIPAGYPPKGGMIPEAVSICKKCIKPKPPRTHHCSICNKCILKMDHHCRHYNHRYFFQYMVYAVLGVIFVIVFGLQLAYEEFFLSLETEVDGHPVRINYSEIIPLTELFDHLSKEEKDDMDKQAFEKKENEYKRKLIVLVALICVATLAALGALIFWHAGLISRGETSIEGRINNSLEKKFKAKGKKYNNPYDFGYQENWKIFLGLQSRSWWYLLFPSVHGPYSNGLVWDSRNTEKLSE